MFRIRNKDTKLEIMLRKTLFAHGFRYRVNIKKLPKTKHNSTTVVYEFTVTVFSFIISFNWRYT